MGIIIYPEVWWMLGFFILLALLPDATYSTLTSLAIEEGIERRENMECANFDLVAYSAFGLNDDNDY